VHPLRVMTAVVALTILRTSCSSGTSSASHTTTSTTIAPLPAGPTPSSLAVQICATEAREGIASTLGAADNVSSPTWSASEHLYSCAYRYPSGSFTLEK